jgi:hypothetical protein
MEPIPNYGDHMTIQEFQSMVNVGLFTDYDGHGVYATATEMSDITVHPSDLYGREDGRGKNFTHVVWFNK